MNEAQARPLVLKQQASCDNKTRKRSLGVLLNSWLPAQSQISDDNMKKLWKGLFYCVWHADKLPAQTHLIDSLSSILLQLYLPLSVHYLSVFLLTMRREWTGIDALRIDRFYLLIRKFMHSFFILLKKNSWDLELPTLLMGVLGEGTFLADDNSLRNGVNYHIAFVFLEELRSFLPLSKQVIDVLLGPFLSAIGKVQDKILLAKIKSDVFVCLLKMGNKLLEVKKSKVDVETGDDALMLGSITLTLEFSAEFCELGSAVECPQGNRKVLFGLHEQFLKLEKDFASLGIDICLPEVNKDTNEDKVPTLVPLSIGMEMACSNSDAANLSGCKRLKKCKWLRRRQRQAAVERRLRSRTIFLIVTLKRVIMWLRQIVAIQMMKTIIQLIWSHLMNL
ncbi:hypothetical protein P3X46_016120 [Hevea brasiliensis]|uniref:Uncharacterized protein n=1 Tax=Hevea brasiliensis TaxID=3981 RepID=A0ABQ9M010_HEVBR|nr:hypothetical protein P3X46_016120 [Hevea brasiliensis]